MKSSRCPKRATRSASPSWSSSSARQNYRSSARTSASNISGALSPVHSASLTLAVLVLSAVPLCASTPAFLSPSTIQHEQLLNQIDNACSSYLSAEQPLRTSDVLRDFCGLMLGVLRKSQVNTFFAIFRNVNIFKEMSLQLENPVKDFYFITLSRMVLDSQMGRPLCSTLSCSSYPSSIAEDAEEWSH
ncbi:hypothetical protein NFI96_010864, partial [Prochilodus magdalenae]